MKSTSSVGILSSTLQDVAFVNGNRWGGCNLDRLRSGKFFFMNLCLAWLRAAEYQMITTDRNHVPRPVAGLSLPLISYVVFPSRNMVWQLAEECITASDGVSLRS